MKVLMLSLLLAFTLPALAQNAPSTASAVSTAIPWVKAEVVKVDLAAHRVTLKHEAIPNLDMSGMTMTFKAAPTVPLRGLRVGQMVVVQVDKINGTYTALQIEPTP